MKIHEFFQKYSNTPLDNRFNIVSIADLGLMTLSDVYKELSAIEDEIRPYVIREQKLLQVIEDLKMFRGIDIFKKVEDKKKGKKL